MHAIMQVNPGHASNPSDVHVVNFLSLEAMLFGIGDEDGLCGSEQGGVYNRHFTGLSGIGAATPCGGALAVSHTSFIRDELLP